MVFCYLNRTTNHSIERNCILSSMVSGVGYLFYPRFIAFTMGITYAVESAYHCYAQKLKECKQDLPAIMKFINKLNVPFLLFIFSGGLDMQLRVLYPSLVNKYTHKILSILTNAKGDRIARNFFDVIMGFK